MASRPERLARSRGFRLRKWYLDCVCEDGRVFIGYTAHARWGIAHLSYGQSIIVDTDGKTQDRRSFRKHVDPQLGSGRVEWKCPPVGVLDARWTASNGPIEKHLLHDATGSIEWVCHVPRGQCEIHCDEGVIRGQGYVDEIEITIPPWQLPFDRLYWGRFHSDVGYATWIRWTGSSQLTMVVHDGADVPAPEFEEDALRWTPAGTELRLTVQRTLRKGLVSASALPSIPGLRRIIPRALRRMHEHKVLARGALRHADGTTSTGWAIHERVDWK